MQNLREITLRGVLLGIFITIIFTTANVYLGLKVGFTFASSIPAAVFSMAFFKLFGNTNILENNIVQTQVSAAGTLSAVVFIIPSLFFVGYWSGFDFWQTFIICSCGGILGVIFTIPFRIQLVQNSNLPYPEGVAAAEVLQLGEKKGASGTKEMLLGALLSSTSVFLSQGLKLTSDGLSYFFNFGKSIFQIPLGFSLALVGAGWLVGISVGCAILVGIILAWFMIIPLLTQAGPSSNLADMAMQVWKHDVRFIGVGMIAISAIWTFLVILKPTLKGMKNSLRFSNSPTTDIPLKWLMLCFGIVFILIVFVFYHFISQSSLPPHIAWSFIIVMSVASIFVGFLISATCGYMAGLVGSSSSPISGVGIIGVVLLSLCVLSIAKAFDLPLQDKQFFIALSLFATSIVFAVATIANDNLQDLKTGAILKATPWKQEVILMLGCIVGASVIAPILNLLYEAYGFVGHLPRAGMNDADALNAPQAVLMATITEGIFTHTLNWTYINIGLALGAIAIAVNAFLQRFHLSLPPLAIGMGIYLPPIYTIPIFFGALLAYFAQKQISKTPNQELQQRFKRQSTLLASGLIVGESLMGIFIAGVIVLSIGSDSQDPLAIEIPEIYQQSFGILFFLIAVYLIYKRLTRIK